MKNKPNITFTFDGKGRLVDITVTSKELLKFVNWVKLAKNVKLDKKVLKKYCDYIVDDISCTDGDYCNYEYYRAYGIVEKQNDIPYELAARLFDRVCEWNSEYNDDDYDIVKFKKALMEKVEKSARELVDKLYEEEDEEW